MATDKDKYVTVWELHCFLAEVIKKYGPNIPVVFEDRDPANAKIGIAPCRNYSLGMLLDERSETVQPVFIVSEKKNPFPNPA